MSRNLGRPALMLAAAVLTTGCATQPRPLYYWGEYQSTVYGYLKRDESPQAQLAKLEETAAKARSENLPLPPGFSAQLGLLYIASGEGAKAKAAFENEGSRFPESKPYMDFLLKKPPTATKAVVPAQPVVKPEAPVKPAPAKAAPAKKGGTK